LYVDIKQEEVCFSDLSQFNKLYVSNPQDIPLYPGDPKPDFEPSSTIEKDNYNVTRITMSMLKSIS
jgi:kynurenine formamidase